MYITPCLISAFVAISLSEALFDSGSYPFPQWATALGWVTVILIASPIPVCFILASRGRGNAAFTRLDQL